MVRGDLWRPAHDDDAVMNEAPNWRHYMDLARASSIAWRRKSKSNGPLLR